MPDILVGLIGDNISRSQAPALHRLAGEMSGLDVRYDRLIPADIGKDFDAVFADCISGGYRGINVTYPYKERAALKVRIDDPLVRRMGAVNTIIFQPDGPTGHNTDYTGFITAYRTVMGDAAPGPVCMIGAGGVGKAVAFGLVALGVEKLDIVERDMAKAEALAAVLRPARPGLDINVASDPADAARHASGLINCTPVGMAGYEGTVLERGHFGGSRWAFDAVYTPVDTQFLQDAAAAGLTVVSGYELFFHQGVDAWEIFAGKAIGHGELRRRLAGDQAGPDRDRQQRGI